MKTVVYLKSGGFSIHPARGPIIMCKKDETAEINADHAEILEDAGWAEILEVEEVGDPVVPPWEQEDWDPDAENAKDMLEAYAIDVFDVDVDKRKSVSTIIDQLEGLKE